MPAAVTVAASPGRPGRAGIEGAAAGRRPAAASPPSVLHPGGRPRDAESWRASAAGTTSRPSPGGWASPAAGAPIASPPGTGGNPASIARPCEAQGHRRGRLRLVPLTGRRQRRHRARGPRPGAVNQAEVARRPSPRVGEPQAGRELRRRYRRGASSRPPRRGAPTSRLSCQARRGQGLRRARPRLGARPRRRTATGSRPSSRSSPARFTTSTASSASPSSPRSRNRGAWATQKAADYRRAGRGRGRVQDHDLQLQRPQQDNPGPQAPAGWVDRVLTFAERTVWRHSRSASRSTASTGARLLRHRPRRTAARRWRRPTTPPSAATPPRRRRR